MDVVSHAVFLFILETPSNHVLPHLFRSWSYFHCQIPCLKAIEGILLVYYGLAIGNP